MVNDKWTMVNEQYEILAWDTEFFGFPVARIIGEISDKKTWKGISTSLISDGIKLAYYSSLLPQDWLLEESLEYEVSLADLKVTYLKSLEIIPAPPDNQVQPYGKDFPEEQLIQLAIESGIYSRYNRDKRFERGKYEDLYKMWINNSVNKSIAEEVLVYREEGRIAGFITLGIKKSRGDIGIIAVDSQFRGKKIGSKLIAAAEYWFYQRNLKQVQVVTQGENLPACRLYESCGYQQDTVIYFYHLWKRQ